MWYLYSCHHHQYINTHTPIRLIYILYLTTTGLLRVINVELPAHTPWELNSPVEYQYEDETRVRIRKATHLTIQHIKSKVYFFFGRFSMASTSFPSNLWAYFCLYCGIWDMRTYMVSFASGSCRVYSWSGGACHLFDTVRAICVENRVLRVCIWDDWQRNEKAYQWSLQLLHNKYIIYT